jgi:hypothetical protein
MFPLLIEFFDAGFLRLLWALFVEYLVASGFLTSEQHDQWIDGLGHIIGIAGTVVFLAIWQWHSHKKSLQIQTTEQMTVTDSPASAQLMGKFFSGLKSFAVKTTTTTTAPVEPPAPNA